MLNQVYTALFPRIYCTKGQNISARVSVYIQANIVPSGTYVKEIIISITLNDRQRLGAYLCWSVCWFVC